MCTFITSWINEPIDQSKLTTILKSNGFDFDEFPDSPLKAKLKAQIYFRPTKSPCDCGTELGSKSRESKGEEPMEIQVQRLTEKGWGESKINRSIENKERTQKKSARENESKNRRGQSSATIQEWMNLLKDLLINNGIKSFGVLFHHYHGNQAIEDFSLESKIKLNLNKIGELELMGLKSETPYEFVNQPNKY